MRRRGALDTKARAIEGEGNKVFGKEEAWTRLQEPFCSQAPVEDAKQRRRIQQEAARQVVGKVVRK